jgi:hypothetical protein
MRRRRCTLVLAGCLSAAMLFAQQLAPRLERNVLPHTDAVGIGVSRDGALSKQFDKRFVHATRRYKLTPEQQVQVKSILLKEQKDTQTVSADTFMPGRDKRAEVAHLYETSQQEIGTILTKQQKRKFDADEKRRTWMDGRLPEPNPGPALGSW